MLVIHIAHMIIYIFTLLYVIILVNFVHLDFFPPTIIAASSKSHYIYNETAAHQKSLSRQNCKIYDVRE